MKKRMLALALTLVLAVGLVPTATAYTTADFSDVPSTHWAYDSVMRMADAGVIEGVGGGKFDPNGSVTAEQFITLVGRVVFPDVKAEGKDWSGPYISEAKAKGMLEGTNVTDEAIKNAISRYDMAVILAKAVEILKLTATRADADKINDYGEVPTEYMDAVLTAYGSGLITGDDNRNFNGGNTMRRSEAATVMDRLLNLQKPSSSSGTTAESGEERWYTRYAPIPTYDPGSVEVVQSERIRIDRSFLDPTLSVKAGLYLHPGETLQLAICEVPKGYGYDGSEATWSSDDESIVTVDENGLVTALKRGATVIRVTIPVHYYNNEWTTLMDMQTVYVDP